MHWQHHTGREDLSASSSVHSKLGAFILAEHPDGTFTDKRISLTLEVFLGQKHLRLLEEIKISSTEAQ